MKTLRPALAKPNIEEGELLTLGVMVLFCVFVFLCAYVCVHMYIRMYVSVCACDLAFVKV